MELRVGVVGLALLCASWSSHGLVLGPVAGAALIGRPLELVIPVQGASGEDASAACFEVEVYHGDTRQEPSRVRVSVQAGAQANFTDLRIASASGVDEPVVTVQVRATCTQKVSRQYLMLADLPRESPLPPVLPQLPLPTPSLARVDAIPATPPEPALAPSPASAPQAATPASVTTASGPAAPPRGKPAAAPAAPRKRPPVKVVAVTPRAAASAQRDAGAPPPAKARLVLDTLEMLSDRVANLESATAEAGKPDLSHDAQKVQTLEADVKALLALAAKNEASLLELKTRLQKAEAERFPNEVVYGLLALLAAGLLAWGFWFTRQRHSASWSEAAARDDEPPESRPMPLPEPAPAASPVQDAAATKASRMQALSDMLDRNGPPSEVDVSLVEMSESKFDKLMQSGAAHNAVRSPPAPRSPALSAPAPLAGSPARSGLSAEAVFDVRQQAEFFVSLGQTDRAIRVLEDQISATDVPSPLVYLDLLALLHTPSHKTDFRRVREDFNLLFNANAPEFAQFKDEGKGLEQYPDVLSAITALWPEPKVLAVIETCIVRDPWGATSAPFDLAAFRDLLLLHAMAQSIGAPSAAPSAAAPAPGRMLVPRTGPDTASLAPAANAAMQPDIVLEDEGPASELDLDLSDTHSGGPVTVPTTPG